MKRRQIRECRPWGSRAGIRSHIGHSSGVKSAAALQVPSLLAAATLSPEIARLRRAYLEVELNEAERGEEGALGLWQHASAPPAAEILGRHRLKCEG